jgi:mRNA-degrading endonuclease RelE of RelBE toxin-antitoxin system
MMINYFAITNFMERVSALKDTKRGVYATVEDEVRAAFKNVEIEQIRQNRDMILLDDPRIIIKLRLPDRKHKLAKKDGFRLIYLVYKNVEEVAFLDIYPKNGPMQQLDIDDQQVVNLVKQYIDEKENGTLLDYEI